MKSARNFAKHLLIAGLVILTSVYTADAQRRGGGSRGSGGNSGGGARVSGSNPGSRGSFGGGGNRVTAAPRSGGGFGGNNRVTGTPRGGFGGNNRIAGAPRGGFGGGNRIAALPPRGGAGRFYGGARGNLGRPGYAYRGNYGRPYNYNRGIFGRSFYGAYYRGYYPHIGFRLSVLPFGYYAFQFGGYPYYYNQGLFYRQYADGGDYQVVAPPFGAEVPNLPPNSHPITIDGQSYFEKDGVYYQQAVNQDGKTVYRVAGKDGVLNTDGQQNDQQYDNLPQVGDVVNSLPPNSRPVTINGERLFISPDGVYFQEDNSGSTRIYKVVGVPSDDQEPDDALSNQ